MTLPRDALVEEIRKYFWWHSIDLGGGIVTPGVKTLELMAAEFARTFGPLDLRQKSLLDIGAWNGGFCVEAKRRGALEVTAVDHFTWTKPRFRGRETFDLVNRELAVGAQAVDIDLDGPHLSLASLGQFDFVLFLGVFYHLKDPLAALREAAALARAALVVETYVEETVDPRPSMMFYPRNELLGDPTNWWGPNKACMLELLGMAGFQRVDTIDVDTGDPRNRRAVFHAFRD